MGEKETSTATEEVERRQHGPGPMRPTSSLRESPSRASSGRSIPENSPNDLDDDGNGTFDEDPVAVLKNKTKSNQSNDRLGHEDDPAAVDDDGDGALDEGPLSVLKTKTKSNQSNDRLGREDDPAAVDDDGGGTLDEGPVFVLKQKTKSNQSNDRLGDEGVPDGSGGLDDDGDGVAGVINTTRSNIKSTS